MVLTVEQQQLFRERLMGERERVQAEIAGLDAEIASLGQDQQADGSGASNHLADDATEMMEQERDLALIGNLQERMRDIDRALERLEAGTYGQCQNCGKPIGAGAAGGPPFRHPLHQLQGGGRQAPPPVDALMPPEAVTPAAVDDWNEDDEPRREALVVAEAERRAAARSRAGRRTSPTSAAPTSRR